MTQPSFERVASLGDLPEGTPVSVELSSGEALCLIKVRGEVYAFEDRCSHAEFPLSDGEMVDDHAIECPLHGAQFDVTCGKALSGPARGDVKSFPVSLVGNDVFVELE